MGVTELCTAFIYLKGQCRYLDQGGSETALTLLRNEMIVKLRNSDMSYQMKGEDYRLLFNVTRILLTMTNKKKIADTLKSNRVNLKGNF